MVSFVYQIKEARKRTKKETAGFQKGAEAHYSTSVTATKGEQALVRISVFLMFAAIACSAFIWKSPLAMVLSIVGGIVLVAGAMLLCIFRPLHRAERQKNAVSGSGKVDYSYSFINGQTQASPGQEQNIQQ